jgi:hypothetical protein
VDRSRAIIYKIMITLLLAERPGDLAAFNYKFLLRNGFSDWIDEIVVLIDSNLPTFQNNRSKIKYVRREMNNGFVEHFNYGLDHCSNEWVYMLADDEFPPPALVIDGFELMHIARNHRAVAFPRANWFTWQDRDKPILWPDMQTRLLRRGVRLAGDIHERVDVHADELLELPSLPKYTINHMKTKQMQEASERLYSELKSHGRA